MVHRSIGAIFAFAGLLGTFMLAQEPHPTAPSTQIPPKIKISFPPGISLEKVWLEYELFGPTDGRLYGGLTGSKAWTIPPFDRGQGHIVEPQSFDHYYEIVGLQDGQPVNRVKAMAWTKGCQIVTFDFAVGTTDVVFPFTCVPLKTIPLVGHIQRVDFIGKPDSLRLDYQSTKLPFFFCEGFCKIIGPALRIPEVASATIAADGFFKVNIPDFAGDPFFSGDSSAELELSLTSSYMRVGPVAQDVRSKENGLKIASSYPSEMVFVPFQLGSKMPSGTPAR